MISIVTQGKPGTAMQAFSNTINAGEIETVVDFVRKEFMLNKSSNTAYHTIENGWPNHQQNAIAFPFALGEIALDIEDNLLTEQQRLGKQLFMNSCVTCHDRARVKDEGVIWDTRAVSFPRNNVTPAKLAKRLTDNSDLTTSDSQTGATPYAKHDVVPVINELTSQARKGETLFQKNCAFCHAADGTGKNWIGTFLQPHPRDLTNSEFMSNINKQHLLDVIRNGLPDTTMSAWKSVLDNSEIEAIIAYIGAAFHPVKQ